MFQLLFILIWGACVVMGLKAIITRKIQVSKEKVWTGAGAVVPGVLVFLFGAFMLFATVVSLTASR